jgi:hypothetical protein
MGSEKMKDSLSSVARVCAGIVEMTGNLAQGVRSRGSAVADQAIAKKLEASGKTPANDSPRRQPASRRTVVSEAFASASKSEMQHRSGLEFDVGRFCSELEEWRAALASDLMTPRAIEYQRSAEHNTSVPGLHQSIVPYDSSKSSASLEANVADAVQRLEGRLNLRPA